MQSWIRQNLRLQTSQATWLPVINWVRYINFSKVQWYIPTLLLWDGTTSQSARTLFYITILLTAYEEKRQGNIFQRAEYELEKHFFVTFLYKIREEWWNILYSFRKAAWKCFSNSCSTCWKTFICRFSSWVVRPEENHDEEKRQSNVFDEWNMSRKNISTPLFWLRCEKSDGIYYPSLFPHLL